MKTWFFLLSTFIVLLLWVMMHHTYVEYHEDVHQAIMLFHGCQSTSQEINTLSGATYCHRYDLVSQEMELQELYLHSQNEIKGYHYMVTLMTVFFIIVTGLILFYIWGKTHE